MAAKKSAAKSAPGRPFKKGGDPRQGRGPKKGEGGRPPDAFKAKMQAMVDRDQTLSFLQRCLDGREGSGPYMAALNYATERAFGKEPNVTTLKGDDAAPLRVVVERE